MEFSIAPQNVGGFEYNGGFYNIWASTRNDAIDPELWQFRYQPMLQVELDSVGNINVSHSELPLGIRTSFKVKLFNEKMTNNAYIAVKKLYPTKSEKIQEQNVSALPVRNIRLILPDLNSQIKGAKLITNDLPLSMGAKSFDVLIDVPDKKLIDTLKNYLKASIIEYAISFDAKKTSQNSVRVKYKDIKESNLFVQLNGMNSTDAYVHRDDLRKLTEGISRTISTVGVIENPDKFDSDIYTKILTILTKEISAKDFDDQKWRSTYNSDDLRPDVISKTLNKMITKDENENRWKYHADAAYSAKASAVDLISGESSIKGSYDDEGLRRMLQERNIEAQFEGNKIVVKSINLQQINLGAFSAEGEFVSIVTYIEDGVQEQKGSISLLGLNSNTGQIDFEGRISILEKSISVGTVMAFAGSFKKIDETTGWVLCDGREIPRDGAYSSLFDVIGTLHGAGDGKKTFNLPDFRGYFLRGVTGSSPVDVGIKNRTAFSGNSTNEAGSVQKAATALPLLPFGVSYVGDHTHGDPTWNGNSGPYELAAVPNRFGNFDYGAQSAPTTAAGGHSHDIKSGGDEETRPINKYVYWLIKAF